MTNIATGIAQRRTTWLAGAMLGLSLMFMIQGYFGIDHDSALYLGEAMRLRFPDILNQDLFFAHGSQGSYTLFPQLVAVLSRHLDVSALFLWGTVLGMGLFAAVSWFVLCTLLPDGERFLPWLALLCLPTSYGAYRIFGYAEAFFTPRVFAESLCLLALALLTRKHMHAALLCMLAAGLLHPLQTIGAAIILWIWLVLADRRWLHALWLMLIPAGLAVAGIRPLDGLLHPFDQGTYALAYSYSRHLFVGGWRPVDFQTLAFDVLILLHISQTLSPQVRRWSLAAVTGLFLALATSFLLADVLRLVLPAGLQLWRTHWLAHWLAMAGVGLLMQRDLGARDTPRLLLLALSITLAYGRPGWGWMPFGLLYLLWPHVQLRLRPRVRHLLIVGIGMAIGLFFLDYIGSVYAEFQKANYQLARIPFDRAFFTFPVLSLGLAVTGAWLWQRGSAPLRLILLLGLLPLSVHAALRWDSRPALYKALEAHAFQPDLFGVSLPEHAQVYWERASTVANWLVINRADYYSPQQLSGLVFSPGAAQDVASRMARLKPLGQDAQQCLTSDLPIETKRQCRISNAALLTACKQHGDSRAPDYLILPYREPVAALGSWTVFDASAASPWLTYWLYSCMDVRKSLASTALQ